MKTIKEFAAQSHIDEALIRAVTRQAGGWGSFKELARDVADYGADGGFHGFIYYTDTVKFFNNNRAEILDLAKRLADDLGENVMDMIGGFRCLDATSEEVGKTLYGPKREVDTQVANALAWLALEEVSRSFVDLTD